MDAERVPSAPLFDEVPRDRYGELGRLIDQLEVPAGAVLTRQGEYAREFFIILEGAAAVVRDDQRVATLGPGDFFGEVGLLSTTWRVATVEALLADAATRYRAPRVPDDAADPAKRRRARRAGGRGAEIGRSWPPTREGRPKRPPASSA